MAHKANIVTPSEVINTKPTPITNVRTAKTSRNLFDLYKALPNPDEILIKNNLTIAEYEKLYLDDTVAAASNRFISGVLAFEYEIDQGKAPDDIYNSTRAMIDELPVKKYMGYILEAFAYGYSASEIVYELGNFGRWTPKKLLQRPPSWFSFTPDSELLFKSKRNPQGESNLPEFGFLVAKQKETAENPYGDGNLKRSYWPVQIKKYILKLLPTFIEDYGMPVPVFTYDPVQYDSPEVVEELARGLFNLWGNGKILVPKDEVSVDLKAAFGSASDGRIFTQALEYFDSQIAKIWLGHSSAMDATPGKLGSEQSAITASEDIIQAGVSLIEETFDTLIEYFNKLNYGYPANLQPTFKLRRKGIIDLTKIQRDTLLKKEHGVDFTEEYYIQEYELRKGSFVLRPVLPTSPSGFIEVDSKEVTIKEEDDQTAIENLSDEVVDNNDTGVLTDTLVSLLQGATSPEEVRAILNSEAGFNAIDTSQLEEGLARSYFSTSLLGNESIGDTEEEVE